MMMTLLVLCYAGEALLCVPSAVGDLLGGHGTQGLLRFGPTRMELLPGSVLATFSLECEDGAVWVSF